MTCIERDCFGQTPLHHAARFGNLKEEGGVMDILNSSVNFDHLKTQWAKLHIEATRKYDECLKDIENKDAGSNSTKMSRYSWRFDAKFGDLIANGKSAKRPTYKDVPKAAMNIKHYLEIGAWS